MIPTERIIAAIAGGLQTEVNASVDVKIPIVARHLAIPMRRRDTMCILEREIYPNGKEPFVGFSCKACMKNIALNSFGGGRYIPTIGIIVIGHGIYRLINPGI
jgi:hypothetical protein